MKYILRSTTAIAWATFLEALRNRLLFVSLFFGISLIALSISAASVSLLERSRIIIDVGLASASGLGSIIAIAIGISTFASDIRRRTAYTVLVRPLPRYAFVLGKFLGVYGTMSLVVTAMFISTWLAVLVFGGEMGPAFWPSLWLLQLEIIVVSAIAIFFSSQTEPVLAAAFSFGLLIAGNLSADILSLAERLADKGEMLNSMVLRGIYHALPDIGVLSLRSQAANAMAIPQGFVTHATLYALLYSSCLLLGAAIIFHRRRDF